MNLKNKTVLVTGATRGIGEATSRLLARRGAHVIATGRDVKRGKKLQNECNGMLRFRPADLTDRKQLNDFLAWLDSEVDSVDALVNNASRDSRFTVLDLTYEEWDNMVSLDMTAPIFLAQAVAKKMIKAGIKGKIINVGAIQSYRPLEASLAYASTKGGLNSATRSMAIDLGKLGIQVIAVLPGPIYHLDGEVPADLDARVPTLLKRMGRMEEVAKLLAFLVSDDNTFMTGNEILIDGGRILSRQPDPEEITHGPL